MRHVDMKIRMRDWNIYYAFLGVGTLAVAIFLVSTVVEGRQTLIEQEFKGIVDEIDFKRPNHGFPDVLINGSRQPMWEDKMTIEGYLQIGDSLVKERGEYHTRIYRRSNNKFVLIDGD